MSSSDAFGILKNWSTEPTCLSLKTIVVSPAIRWSATHVTIEEIDTSSLTLMAVDSLERKTVSLDGAEITALEGIKAITVKLANGDQFLLEEDGDFGL